MEHGKGYKNLKNLCLKTLSWLFGFLASGPHQAQGEVETWG